jgi:hypothetical protein
MYEINLPAETPANNRRRFLLVGLFFNAIYDGVLELHLSTPHRTHTHPRLRPGPALCKLFSPVSVSVCSAWPAGYPLHWVRYPSAATFDVLLDERTLY